MPEEITNTSGFEPGTFEYRVAEKASMYLDEDERVPPLAVEFAIAKFKDRINFPHSFTGEQISAVMENNISTIAMAVVDLTAKAGGEGETSHTDSGTARQYENAYLSLSLFADIVPYVDTPF